VRMAGIESSPYPGVKPMIDEKKIRAMAAAIQTKTAGAGYVCLLRDAEGRAHLIPGHSVELVAVYGEGVKTAWIADDLIDAGIER